ncbi:MAG: hypothetical protein WC584_01565 [Candidatus Pacearchaeota archaeon]
MTKKIILGFFCIIFLSSLVIAQNYKLEISLPKDVFEAGEKITLKVSLLDSANKPIDDNVNIILEDATKKSRIEKTIQSNQFVDIDLGENAPYGFWNIKATYQGIEANGLFSIGANELARFELKDDKLTITNIGNTKYSKTIQIIIGETTGIKNPELSIGESIFYRLVAPEGNYNIKVTDGKTTLTKAEVRLTGTGKVIGALDERAGQTSGITGTLSPEENSEGELFSYVRNNKFTYIFVLVIFGAMILLAIERRYKKKASR